LARVACRSKNEAARPAVNRSAPKEFSLMSILPQDALSDLLEIFASWLHMADTGSVEITLAAYAAKRLARDPMWLMLVGPPSAGKGEILNPISRLPHTHEAATITEAALMSGSSKQNREKNSTGGLLKQIGAFGILLLKDFTSVLSMNRDTRASLL